MKICKLDSRQTWLFTQGPDAFYSGENVTALNWLCPNIVAAEKVIVAYDPHEDRWTVVAAE